MTMVEQELPGKTNDVAGKKIDRKIRLLTLAGFIGVGLVIGGGGAWATYSQINGAVVASGQLVVEGDLKRVQHREGGTVSNILVKNGDRVAEGQPLVQLDTLELGSELRLITQQKLEWMAKLHRLQAERDDLEEIVFPDELIKAQSPIAKELVSTQTKLFNTQRAAIRGRIAQLGERIDQLGEEIAGLTAQRTAYQKQFAIAKEELDYTESLLTKGLVQRARVLQVQREVARLEGADGQLISDLAKAEGKISETRLQIIQLTDDNRSRTLEELREAESKFREFSDRKETLESKIERATINAPWSGIVHEMTVFNSGGVIAPGQAIMAIVPENEALVVEASVSPQNIDQVFVGQKAELVFENANNRITPRLNGKVELISAYLANQTQDEQPPTYTVRLSADSESMSLLDGLDLRPGMPVTAFIQTSARTPLSFILKPAREILDRSMIEK